MKQKKSDEKIINEIVSKKIAVICNTLQRDLKNGPEIDVYKMEEEISNIPYLVAMAIVGSGALAYWSAMFYHNLTDRNSMVLYVQTTQKRGYTHWVNLGGERVIKVRNYYVKPVVVKPEKYFGIEEYTDEHTGIIYRFTDREKTVVDCVDKPKYCGGYSEIIAGLYHANLNLKKIMKYAEQLKNYTVIKRLGYISEKLEWGITDYLRELLPENALNTYAYMDPSGPYSNKKDESWKLIINVPNNIWEVEIG